MSEDNNLLTIVGFRRDDPRITGPAEYYKCILCPHEVGIGLVAMKAILTTGKYWQPMCFDCMQNLEDDQVSEVNAIEPDASITPLNALPSDFKSGRISPLARDRSHDTVPKDDTW